MTIDFFYIARDNNRLAFFPRAKHVKMLAHFDVKFSKKTAIQGGLNCFD